MPASGSSSPASRAPGGSSRPSTPRRTSPPSSARSAVGYYGKHGDERIDETAAPGDDFLAQVCVAWENEANHADTRVVIVRTGVVLDQNGGALSKMLLPFKAGVGGPVAGGKQYMPWIHVDDVVGIYLKAIDDPSWEGPRQRHRAGARDEQGVQPRTRPCAAPPAVAPIPAFAIRTAVRRHGGDRDRGPARDSDAGRWRSDTRSATRISTSAQVRDIAVALTPSLKRMGLPPELDRLGGALTHAAARPIAPGASAGAASRAESPPGCWCSRR